MGRAGSPKAVPARASPGQAGDTAAGQATDAAAGRAANTAAGRAADTAAAQARDAPAQPASRLQNPIQKPALKPSGTPPFTCKPPVMNHKSALRTPPVAAGGRHFPRNAVENTARDAQQQALS